MANTYTQIHIQTIFAVSNRQSLISGKWEDELYKYITGIIQNQGHKVLQFNGTTDHIHIVFGMRPNQSLSDLMKNVKQDSSAWINKKGFINGRFSWQAGYGAFSNSKSDLPRVIEYVRNQKQHHKKESFMDEYLRFLKEFEIDFDERYILKAIS
ncbi:MAG: IS200/IS605 family transposase [Maribacter sp.]|uniref:IS200/IS605 family transposase n=1 Tax=Maribacter sp. TaxID=1897614 RepID=UPI003C71728A